MHARGLNSCHQNREWKGSRERPWHLEDSNPWPLDNKEVPMTGFSPTAKTNRMEKLTNEGVLENSSPWPFVLIVNERVVADLRGKFLRRIRRTSGWRRRRRGSRHHSSARSGSARRSADGHRCPETEKETLFKQRPVLLNWSMLATLHSYFYKIIFVSRRVSW